MAKKKYTNEQELIGDNRLSDILASLLNGTDDDAIADNLRYVRPDRLQVLAVESLSRLSKKQIIEALMDGDLALATVGVVRSACDSVLADMPTEY